MRVLYTKWHNNYPFAIGYEYEAYKYKEGWLSIDGQLYREDCFAIINDTLSKDEQILNEINKRWDEGELSWNELRYDYLWLKSKCNELMQTK